MVSVPLRHFSAFACPTPALTPSLRTLLSNTTTLPRPPHRAVTTARAAHPPPSPSSPKRESLPPSRGALSQVGQLTPIIQWYPGHIAKAERALRDAIKLVDVVIEVRDCRIPISTTHPSINEWTGSRARVVAMNRADLAPELSRSMWREELQRCGERVRFVDAKAGRGVRGVKELAVQAGLAVNERRRAKGLMPRPVRALVMGYPNVGKSALINRLVGRNTAKSANKPGVTRNFQWIRMAKDIELLDMPGIIPVKLERQDSALRLAICDDIGQGAYDVQMIAALMVEEVKKVALKDTRLFDLGLMKRRFKTDTAGLTGEEFLHFAADRVASGDVERTAVRLLKEFRLGTLGPAALEWPGMLEEEEEG